MNLGDRNEAPRGGGSRVRLAAVGLFLILSDSMGSRKLLAACEARPLAAPPGWFFAATRDGQSGQVLLADAFAGRVYALDSKKGTFSVVLSRPGSGELDLPRPGLTLELGGRIWVQQESGRVLRLSSSFEPERALSLDGTVGGHRLFARAIGTSRNRFLALGFLSEPSGAPSLAVWSVEPDRSADFALLGSQSWRKALRVRAAELVEKKFLMYESDFPAFAAIGERVFFLDHLVESAVVELAVDKTAPIVKLDSAFAPASLPPAEGFAALEPMAAALSRMNLAVQLYAWEGKLFVLLRAQGGPGPRRILVEVVDPDRGLALGRLRLPGAPEHVTLLVGDREWLVFEKGRVVEGPRFEGVSLRRIPAEAVRRGIAELERRPGRNREVVLCEGGL